MDSCDELEYYNTEAIDVTFHGESVCGYVHWVYVAICTFEARIPAIIYFFLRQSEIGNLDTKKNAQLNLLLTHIFPFFSRAYVKGVILLGRIGKVKKHYITTTH